jgi:excisionase family DNA binding protein
MDRLLTPEQMAEKLGVKLCTIYQWTHEGYIPHLKLGRLVRFREADINRWLDKRLNAGREHRSINILGR